MYRRSRESRRSNFCIKYHPSLFNKEPGHKQPSIKHHKIKKLLKLEVRAKKLLTNKASKLLGQRKTEPKQCDYDIALEFSSY